MNEYDAFGVIHKKLPSAMRRGLLGVEQSGGGAARGVAPSGSDTRYPMYVGEVGPTGRFQFSDADVVNSIRRKHDAGKLAGQQLERAKGEKRFIKLIRHLGPRGGRPRKMAALKQTMAENRMASQIRRGKAAKGDLDQVARADQDAKAKVFGGGLKVMEQRAQATIDFNRASTRAREIALRDMKARQRRNNGL